MLDNTFVTAKSDCLATIEMLFEFKYFESLRLVKTLASSRPIELGYDIAEFLNLMREAQEKTSMRLTGLCLMTTISVFCLGRMKMEI